MAVELAHAFVGISPSFKGMRTAINKEFGGLESTASASGVTMGRNLGGGFAGAFKKVAGPALAVLGAGAIANFAKTAVGGFSELEDSTAAASVVFGDSMQKIIDQSAGASKNIGLTKQQVINAANTFGTYGKAAGLSGDALANFATEQTALAADMASFKGTSPEQAIEAIGAALRGETEPIRAYGVMLDDASLRNEALAKGLISTTKDALTPQQKTLAAQSLILKQTADAQGDFARTSDSTANVAKTLTAETADLSAKMGAVLAPAFTAARTAAIGAVGGVSGILDKVTAFQGVLAGGGTTLDLVSALGLDPSKGFGLLVNEGIGSINAFGAAWKANDGEVTSSGLPGFMEKFAYSLRQGFEKIIPVVTQLGPPLLALLMAISPVQLVFQALLPVLPQVTSIIGQLAVIAGQLAAVIASGLTIALQVLAPVISGLLTGLAGFVSGITSSEAGVTLLMAALSAAAGVWLLVQGRILATTIATKAHILVTKAQGIAAKAAAAGQWLLNAALTANPLGIVAVAVAALVGGLVYFFTQTEVGRKVIETVWGAIKGFIGGVVAWFQNTALPMIQNVFRAVGAVFSFLYNNVVKPVFNGIKWYIGAWWTVVSGIFSVVVALVKNVLGPAFSWLYNNAIKPAFDWISSKISDVWKNNIRPVFNALKDAVGLIPGAFTAAKDGIGRAWDAIKAKVKEPIRASIGFINEGLIAKFNSIPGVDIKPLKMPPGFKNGGYTGNGRADEFAGHVHKGEYVFTKEQTAALGKDKLAAMAHSAVRGGKPQAAVGSSVYGGIPSFNGRDVQAIDGANRVRINGDGASNSHWFLNQAVRMWNGLANLTLIPNGPRSGSEPLVAASEGPSLYGNILNGGWAGYYANSGIRFNPAARYMSPVQRRTVAAHEVGHAIGLPHAMATGARSIMNYDNMFQHNSVTAADAAALRSIYGAPGAGNKASTSQPLSDEPNANPFDGLVDWFAGKLKEKFPGGGMFIDAAGGLAKEGIGQVVKMVTDIKNGIGNIAGNVFDSIKGFFGGGAAVAPTLYDNGGVLPTNGGKPFLVQNKTRKPEIVHTQGQLAERDAHMRGHGSGVVINGNVGWMPDQVAREIEVRRRRAQVMAGMGGVVFA